MNGDDTIRIRRKPGDPPLETGTDWVRLDAMTDEEIRAGVAADPDARTLTDADLKRMRRLVDVKRLRERLGMTRDQFAGPA